MELLLSIYYIQGTRLMDEGSEWECNTRMKTGGSPRLQFPHEQKDACVG